MRRSGFWALLSILILNGCAYYRVTEPSGQRAYYTQAMSIQNGYNGAMAFHDFKSGDDVVLQQHQMHQISKEEFERAIAPDASAAQYTDSTSMIAQAPAPFPAQSLPPRQPAPPSGPLFQPYSVPAGQGVAYVYRLGMDDPYSDPVEIRCDNTKIGSLSENGYAGVFLSPGRHTISAGGSSDVSFTTEAGKSYYVATTLSGGRAHLTVVPEEEGKTVIVGKHWFGVAR